MVHVEGTSVGSSAMPSVWSHLVGNNELRRDDGTPAIGNLVLKQGNLRLWIGGAT
jgi:hypothetical protein